MGLPSLCEAGLVLGAGDDDDNDDDETNGPGMSPVRPSSPCPFPELVFWKPAGRVDHQPPMLAADHLVSPRGATSRAIARHVAGESLPRWSGPFWAQICVIDSPLQPACGLRVFASVRFWPPSNFAGSVEVVNLSVVRFLPWATRSRALCDLADLRGH